MLLRKVKLCIVADGFIVGILCVIGETCCVQLHKQDPLLNFKQFTKTMHSQPPPFLTFLLLIIPIDMVIKHDLQCKRTFLFPF